MNLVATSTDGIRKSLNKLKKNRLLESPMMRYQLERASNKQPECPSFISFNEFSNALN